MKPILSELSACDFKSGLYGAFLALVATDNEDGAERQHQRHSSPITFQDSSVVSCVLRARQHRSSTIMARILSVGPDREILATRNRALARSGREVYGAATHKDAVTLAKTHSFDFVLICNLFPLGYASKLAEKLRAIIPTIGVLMIGDGDAAIEISAIEEKLSVTASRRVA